MTGLGNQQKYDKLLKTAWLPVHFTRQNTQYWKC